MNNVWKLIVKMFCSLYFYIKQIEIFFAAHHAKHTLWKNRPQCLGILYHNKKVTNQRSHQHAKHEMKRVGKQQYAKGMKIE